LKLTDRFRSSFYEKYKKIEIREHNLLYLFLEITKRCNMSCLHCGSDCKTVPDSPELTTESWFKIIDYFVANYSKQLVFVITGGEPTLHPDLAKIGAYITSKNRRWGMVTNGMLLNQDKFAQLVKAGLYSITLSLDGLEKAHNILRNNPKAFQKVLETLEIIGKSSVKFKDVVTCVYSENLNDLDALGELLLHYNINSWRLFRIFSIGRAAANPQTKISFEQTQTMLDWLAKNRPKYIRKGLSVNYSCEGWMPFDRDRTIREQPFFCRAGVNIASILADGNITGCSNNHSDFYRGNILTEDFAKVWNTNFDDFRHRNWLKNTVCISCEHIEKCQGSSIHLWDLKSERPSFCYVKNLDL
jgi:radical SAM protein with 4Fe4S-binding SPASM domain